MGQVDRLDVMAAQYLGDPELFWRICDANGAMRPEEFTAWWDAFSHLLPQAFPEDHCS